MSVAVQLPELGESVVEGTIARWLVKEGDRVEVDQPLVEVTTDKVDAEIPSPVAGVLETILAAEGETVPVGAEIARIAPAAGAAERPAAPRPAAAPRPGAAAPRPAADPTAADVRATPVARRLAEESRVDLGAVQATGPAGRVTKDDVQRHLGDTGRGDTGMGDTGPGDTGPRRERRGGEADRREAPAPRAEAPRATAPRTAARSGGVERGRAERPRPDFSHYSLEEGDRVIPMSPLRKLVAEHMVYSKRTAPHVGTVAEVDLGGVVAVRDRHKRAFQETHGVPLTFLPFVVHATVRALREFPQLNASVLEDAIVEKKDVHVGVAVETEKGLIVPVVRHADRLSLAGLAAGLEDLSSRARSKRLSADELKGGTFTVSNPGRDGNLYGFAIINQPQVGILRMGEIVKRPVVRSIEGDDAIVIRPIMYLALSYDHRAVDGAPANAFLHRVRELLEAAEFDL